MQFQPLSSGLSGLKIVDLGRGLSAGIAAKFLADLGASVHRFTLGADPFAEFYPAYPVWHAGAVLTSVKASDDPALEVALCEADLCVVGGEDFPGYDWAPDASAIASNYPRLVVLEIQAYPEDDARAGRPAVEGLVQARSGIAWEQYSGRPIRVSVEMGGYGAALLGLSAALAALCQRERDGTGQVVRTSLYEGVLSVAMQYWYRASEPSGSFNIRMPLDPYPLIFECRDGRYIHFVLGSFASKGRVYRILEIDDPSVGPDDSGMPTGRGDPKNFFGDIDVLAAHVIKFDSADLVEQIRAAGVAVNYVLAPGECWDDDQVAQIDMLRTAADGTRYTGLPMHGRVTPFDAGNQLATEQVTGAAPLAGIRVIDFGIFVAGPFGSVGLADLGADVIKVETPQGDPNRNVFRSFATVNRGKRAIAIDLKTVEGLEIARRLAAGAEIMHNNFRPGVSARLGVDPETQHGIDPNKIVLESTGYGRSGPYAGLAGFDMVFQAYCGHEVRGGGAGNPPLWDRSSMVDYVTGLVSTLATLVAIWRRFRGAGGADLELSLLDAGLLMISELVETPGKGFEGAPILNAAQTGYHPAEALYQCADGWIAIAARGDDMAAKLAGVLGIEAGARALWGQAEGDRIAGALIALTVEDALARLDRAGIWADPCVKGGERLFDDDGISAGLISRSHHPVFGDLQQIGALFRLGDGRPNRARGVPLLGANTREILLELGYGVEEIEDFYTRRIVA